MFSFLSFFFLNLIPLKVNHFYIVYYQEGSGELYPYVYETTTKKKQGNIFSGVSTKIMGITLVQRNRPPKSHLHFQMIR